MTIEIDRQTGRFILQNTRMRRVLQFDASGLYTASLVNLTTQTEYVTAPADEFFFTVNGEKIHSYSECKLREVDGNLEQQQSALSWQNADATPESLQLTLYVKKFDLTLNLTYQLFADTPGLVKQLTFQAGKIPLKISELAFDTFNFYPGNFRDCAHFLGASREEQPPCFSSESAQDVVICHNSVRHEGFLAATSAPGVLRRLFSYPNWKSRDISYAMGSMPFAKYLASGEAFSCDSSLLLLYAGERETPREEFRTLVRHLLPETPPAGVMYCTWLPFLKSIDEKLVLELARQVAALKGRYFVLDDGWFTAPRRAVDATKFPHGLKYLFDEVRKLGLAPGLWYNIGSAYGAPDTSHRLACRDAAGKIKNNGDYPALCWGSCYREQMLQELSDLARDYGIAYFKLDFSTICSPYDVQPWGCHCQNHTYHHNFSDSVIEMYRGFAWLRRELRKSFPHLLIDFSFETFGSDLPTIGALKLSDFNHVSNYSGLNTDWQNIRQIRRTFYRWFELLPVERLLGGLLVLNNESALEYLLTSFVGAPLVSGDLRLLSPELTATLARHIAVFNTLSERGELLKFQVLPSSREVDGFIRSNALGHGLVCYFNRTEHKVALPPECPRSAVNVTCPAAGLTVPAASCAMFQF